MNVVDKQELNSKKEEQNKELVTRERIEGTPFTVIGTEGKFFGTIGRYRITEPKETEREIIEELDVEPTWDRIVQIMLILIETQK